jgi:hypothetical protein
MSLAISEVFGSFNLVIMDNFILLAMHIIMLLLSPELMKYKKKKEKQQTGMLS